MGVKIGNKKKTSSVLLPLRRVRALRPLRLLKKLENILVLSGCKTLRLCSMVFCSIVYIVCKEEFFSFFFTIGIKSFSKIIPGPAVVRCTLRYLVVKGGQRWGGTFIPNQPSVCFPRSGAVISFPPPHSHHQPLHRAAFISAE